MKSTVHAFVHGMTTHPTMLAECCCGVQRHDIPDRRGIGVTWYLDVGAGEFTRRLPPCTRGEDEKT